MVHPTGFDPVFSDLAVRAARALEDGDAKTAEELYREMVRKYPNNCISHENLGVCLYFQKRLIEARECFLKALEVNSRSERAHRCLGANDHAQGRLDEAIKNLTRANEIQEHGLSHWCLALIHDQKGESDEALTHFECALQSGQISDSARRHAEERIKLLTKE